MTARSFTAGAVVMLLGLTPVLLLEWLREEGTVGGIERPLFLGAAGLALLVCGVLAGWSMTRLLRTDTAAADSWATYAAGVCAWTVLVLAAPLFVLIRNAGDEGPGVADAGRILYAQWGMAILLAAGIAVVVAAGAHRYLRHGASVNG
jgi:hypothetical protein